MTTEPLEDALRRVSLSSGDLRFTALYGTHVNSVVRRSHLAAARPAADLFETSVDRPSYHEWMSAAADQLPTVVDVRRVPERFVTLASAAELVRVASCWTWTFDIGEAGFVLAVAVDVVLLDGVDAGDALGGLFDDFDTHRGSLRIDGDSLMALAGLELGFDFHAVIALPESQRTALTPERVQQLVSRRWHVSRPRFISADLHESAVGFLGGVVAVTPGASVVCAIGDDGAMAAVVCAAQALSAIATLRDLQQDVYRMAVRVARPTGGLALSGDDGGNLSENLDKAAQELADYELDLSLGVERFSEMRIFMPVWRIEQYHKRLLDALGVERATAVTALMLRRVSAAVGARQGVLESRRWQYAEHRRRTLSAVTGTTAFIAIPLTIVFAFLGVAVRPVGSHGSALRSGLWPYYAALLGLLALAAGVGWWYVRRHPDPGAPSSRATHAPE